MPKPGKGYVFFYSVCRLLYRVFAYTLISDKKNLEYILSFFKSCTQRHC